MATVATQFFTDIHKYVVTPGQLASIQFAIAEGREVGEDEIHYVIRTQKETAGEMRDRIVLMPKLQMVGQVGLFYVDSENQRKFIEGKIGMKISDMPIYKGDKTSRKAQGTPGEFERKLPSRFLIVHTPGKEVTAMVTPPRNIFIWLTQKERWYADSIARQERAQAPPVQQRQSAPPPVKQQLTVSVPAWVTQSVLQRMPKFPEDKVAGFANYIMKESQINFGQLRALGDFHELDVFSAGVVAYNESYRALMKQKVNQDTAKKTAVADAVDALKERFNNALHAKAEADSKQPDLRG